MADKPSTAAKAPAVPPQPLLKPAPVSMMPAPPKPRAVVPGLRLPDQFEQTTEQKLKGARQTINQMLMQLGQSLPAIEHVLELAEESPIAKELAKRTGVDLKQLELFVKGAELLLNQFAPPVPEEAS
jgi:hypothetical protein